MSALCQKRTFVPLALWHPRRDPRPVRSKLKAEVSHESGARFELIRQDSPCGKQRIGVGRGFAAREGLRQNVSVHPWRSMLAGERDRLIIRGHPAGGPAIDQARGIQQRSDKSFMIAGRENIHLCETMSILDPSRERSTLQINTDLVERWT